MQGQWLDLDSDEWAGVLETGFGSASTEVTEGFQTSRVTIFRAGPFHVAYPEFPVGASTYPAELIDAIVHAARERGVDMLRFHSGRYLQAGNPVAALDVGTHVIRDLRTWDVARIEKARRSRNRSSRSPLTTEKANVGDAAEMYSLYLQTLSRHGGDRRYPLRYFSALASSSSSLVARLEGRVCAFVSFAYQGARACYLHGAHDTSARPYYASDRLFYEMISMAKAHGAEVFDFLPSPANQPSLANYKRAWGAVPAPLIVSDIAVHPLRGGIFRLAKHMAATLPRWR
jgi:hypothetical protein